MVVDGFSNKNYLDARVMLLSYRWPDIEKLLHLFAFIYFSFYYWIALMFLRRALCLCIADRIRQNSLALTAAHTLCQSCRICVSIRNSLFLSSTKQQLNRQLLWETKWLQPTIVKIPPKKLQRTIAHSLRSSLELRWSAMSIALISLFRSFNRNIRSVKRCQKRLN